MIRVVVECRGGIEDFITTKKQENSSRTRHKTPKDSHMLGVWTMKETGPALTNKQIEPRVVAGGIILESNPQWPFKFNLKCNRNMIRCGAPVLVVMGEDAAPLTLTHCDWSVR